MKKTLITILTTVLAVGLVFTGCGDNKDKSTADNTPEHLVEESDAEETDAGETDNGEEIKDLDYENMTAEDLIKDIKDIENITTDETLTLLETYKYVEMDERFNMEDNITDEAFSLLKERDANYNDITEILEQGSQSSEAIVRAEVLQFMVSMFGIKDEHKEIALKLLKTEEDPYVLYTLVKVFGNELSNPEVADFTFKMSEHENPAIRDKAAYAIASPWSKEVDGTVERLIEMMEDEDEEVRKTVYKNAGRVGDERIIDPIVKILMDPEQYDFHSNCMDSLAALWIDFPSYENTSEKAYRATIEYFKFTPRNENVPYWSAISTIATAKPETQDDKFQIWEGKASFYNPSELIDPMFDILKDPETNWMACNSAIDLVQRHGTEEQFDSIKEIIESSEHPDKDTILNSYNGKSNK